MTATDQLTMAEATEAIRQLRAELADLRSRLIDRRGTEPAFASGILQSAITVTAAADATEFTAVIGTIRLYQSHTRDGTTQKRTDETIDALLCATGDFAAGIWCFCIRWIDGNWYAVAAGCEPNVVP
ncbi:MAG: hypothetical protein AAGC97_03535 [Planctomycetota bacterium]